MSDIWKWLGEGLKALGALPVSLFLAVAVAGLLVLYLPPIPGLGLEVVRARAGPWIGLATVAAAALFVVRSLAFIAYNTAKLGLAWRANRSPPTAPSLRFTLNPHIASACWSETEQRDGSIVTQLMLDFFVHNYVDEPMYLRRARLISPRVPLQHTLPAVHLLSHPSGGHTNSASYPITPGGDANGRIVLLFNRAFGRPGKMLRVVIGLTDQTGHEYRLTTQLWPLSPAADGAAPAPTGT